MATRRQALAAAAALAAGYAFADMARAESVSRPRKILILGGTYFLGPAIVDAALASGHSVTLFNRGQTNPGLFPAVEKLHGDRNPDAENLQALAGSRKWDAVIDVWPEDARMVEATATLLRERTDRYLYVSSIAAYARFKVPPPVTEEAPLHPVERYAAGLSYSQGKALCERTLARLMPERNAVVRPTSIVGERDDETTTAWWLWRIRHGGPLLIPGDGKDAVQWIDVKDVGRFIVALIDADRTGAYNAVGPRAVPTTFENMIGAMLDAYGSKALPIWVPQGYLETAGLKSGTDLPLWRPASGWGSFYRVSASKSLAAGLQYRAMKDTFADVLTSYDAAHPGSPHPYNVSTERGISAEREAAVLQGWSEHIAALSC